jgi:hypothetical protein
MQSNADLLQVVLALRSRRRFTHLLHSGKQQADQDGDDRDDDEQFDQRETDSTAVERIPKHDLALVNEKMNEPNASPARNSRNNSQVALAAALGV